MKKLILIATSMAALAVNAQNWTPQNFMADGIVALIVSNNATSGAGITNLASITGQGGLGPGTNIAKTSWWQQLSDIGSNALQSTVVAVLSPWLTNGLYTNYTVTALDATTNTLGNRNLLDNCVPLWVDRNGASIPMNPVANAGTNTFGSIFIRTVGATANVSTNVITFVFESIPFIDKNGNTIGSTAAGDRFIVSTVVSNSTTPMVLITNLPAYKYAGCYGIRCASISVPNGDNNAGNQMYVTDLKLIGFKP